LRKTEAQYEIISTDVRGHYPAVLFKSENPVARPSLSPNYKNVLFVSSDASGNGSGHGPVHIKIATPGGKNLQQLTHGDSVNRDPSFSPDGKQIVFSSNRERNNIFAIYVMNADGTCLKKLTDPPLPKSPTDFFADLYPVISPDGKKLLFTSNRSGKYQIYLADLVIPPNCLPENQP
jgi:TolB protein